MQIYKEWLEANNIKFDEDTYGLDFAYQGCRFVIFREENDESYLNLAMPGIYELKDDKPKVLEALNDVNRELKCVKAVLYNDSVWLNIEMLIDSTPDIEDFMERLLDILMHARMVFMVKMQK